jgi:hypothetical protein
MWEATPTQHFATHVNRSQGSEVWWARWDVGGDPNPTLRHPREPEPRQRSVVGPVGLEPTINAV